MFREPEGLLPPPDAAGSASAPPAPAQPHGRAASSKASTCAQIRVARVELQAGRALAGVAALGVDADAVAFTDPGFQLTFVHVCRGKERVMGACSCVLG